MLLHWIAIARSFVVIGKIDERKGIAPARPLGGSLEQRAYPRNFKPALQRCRGQRQRPPQADPAPSREAVEPGKVVHCLVTVITEETLVTAIAVERHGYFAARHLGDVVGRNGRRVGERLTVMPDQLRCDRGP